MQGAGKFRTWCFLLPEPLYEWFRRCGPFSGRFGFLASEVHVLVIAGHLKACRRKPDWEWDSAFDIGLVWSAPIEGFSLRPRFRPASSFRSSARRPLTQAKNAHAA